MKLKRLLTIIGITSALGITGATFVKLSQPSAVDTYNAEEIVEVESNNDETTSDGTTATTTTTDESSTSDSTDDGTTTSGYDPDKTIGDIVDELPDDEMGIKETINNFLQENFPWLLSVTIGTIISFLGTVIVVSKKLTSVKKETSTNAITMESIKDSVSDATKALTEAKSVTTIVKTSLQSLGDEVTTLKDTVTPLVKTMDTLTQVCDTLITKVGNLENIIALEANSNADYKANGLTTEIAKILQSESLSSSAYTETDGVQDLIDSVSAVEETSAETTTETTSK